MYSILLRLGSLRKLRSMDKQSVIFRYLLRNSNKDPLAIAERGKVGVPSSQSECSSNDSIEASIDSNTGILTGEKKDGFIEGTFGGHLSTYGQNNSLTDFSIYVIIGSFLRGHSLNNCYHLLRTPFFSVISFPLLSLQNDVQRWALSVIYEL
uniref:Uncharacterized protein n=1 Tax=Megaselia scalaris TaxID=36166 RepID=T1GWD6_MEGSC